MRTNRTGRGKAQDVADTLNNVQNIVHLFLFCQYTAVTNSPQVTALYQQTGQSTLILSIRTDKHSHAKPVLYSTVGLQDFFLNKFNEGNTALLDKAHVYATQQVANYMHGERYIATLIQDLPGA